MTTRVVKTEYHRQMLLQYLQAQKPPFTVTIARGAKRSIEQNKLQRLLLNEIAEQWEGVTAEYVRGYCKLRFGVPIMRAESEYFRERYDAIVKPLPYEQKIELMQEPLDLPVTRIMSTSAKTEYLDAIYQHFGAQGYVLTVPELAA